MSPTSLVHAARTSTSRTVFTSCRTFLASVQHDKASIYRTLSSTPGNIPPGEGVAEEKSDAMNEKDPAVRLKNSFQYCNDLVRRSERWDHLVVQQLPPQVAQAVLAVRAFSLETARVRDVVTEPQFRVMRLEFWKQVLNDIYTKDHTELRIPVAICLASLVRDRRLSKRFFTNMINARIQELAGEQPRTMDDIEQYAEQTFSSLNYLSLECADIRDVSTDHAASHLGKAIGITRIMSGMSHHASQRRNWLPMDLAVEHGVSDESVYRKEFSDGLHEVIFQMASVAKIHLDKSRAFSPKLTPGARDILRSSARVERYLELIQQADFNPFDPRLNQPDPVLWWRITKGKWDGTY